jgi:hypothetical protein
VFRIPDNHASDQAMRINVTLGGMDEIDCLSSRGHKCSASTISKPEMSSLTDL